MAKYKKKIKIKWKNMSIFTVFIILLIIFGCSLTYILNWGFDSSSTKGQEKDLNDKSKITSKKDSKDTIIIPQDDIPKSNPYWDYIKMNLIDVDFNELKKINNETVGWIQVKGTNINYPFVQTNDNKYYLEHSFNKSKNSAGWVFMDYRNNLSLDDKNTILYAHGRLDKTMFGSLKNILKNNWLDNTNNYVVKTASEYESSLWQVFSIYHIPTTTDYLKVGFNTDSDYLNFLNTIKNRSIHNFNTTVNENDSILTLSTCYNDDEKMVMHAKLIKKEKK